MYSMDLTLCTCGLTFSKLNGGFNQTAPVMKSMRRLDPPRSSNAAAKFSDESFCLQTRFSDKEPSQVNEKNGKWGLLYSGFNKRLRGGDQRRSHPGLWTFKMCDRAFKDVVLLCKFKLKFN